MGESRDRTREKVGIILAPILHLPEDLGPAEEVGANTCASEAVENRETACPGTALAQAGTPRTGARE